MLKKRAELLHRNYLVFGLITILALVTLAGWLLFRSSYQWDKATHSNSIQTSHELLFNNFRVTVPVDYASPESSDYPPNIYGKVTTSSFSDESGCVRVQNVQSTILQRNITIDTGYSTWHPVLELYSWSNKNIMYIDAEVKSIIQKRLAELTNLSNLSSLDINEMSQNSFQSDGAVPLFNPWQGYITCAGIYSLPSFIEKQELPSRSNLNEVYYGEVYEGNGDTFGAPVKVMIARKDDNWLVVKEEQTYPKDFKSSCSFGELSLKEFNCAKTEWSKLRNPLNYRAWVQQVMSWVY